MDQNAPENELRLILTRTVDNQQFLLENDSDSGLSGDWDPELLEEVDELKKRRQYLAMGPLNKREGFSKEHMSAMEAVISDRDKTRERETETAVITQLLDNLHPDKRKNKEKPKCSFKIPNLVLKHKLPPNASFSNLSDIATVACSRLVGSYWRGVTFAETKLDSPKEKTGATSPRRRKQKEVLGHEYDTSDYRDDMSGVWRMWEAEASEAPFQCTPPGYSAMFEPGWADDDPIDWNIIAESKDKCRKWLAHQCNPQKTPRKQHS